MTIYSKRPIYFPEILFHTIEANLLDKEDYLNDLINGNENGVLDSAISFNRDKASYLRNLITDDLVLKGFQKLNCDKLPCLNKIVHVYHERIYKLRVVQHRKFSQAKLYCQ